MARRRPAPEAAPAPRRSYWKLLGLLALLGLGYWLNQIYETDAARSIMVEADTGALTIELSKTLDKTFTQVTLCQKRAVPDFSAEGAPDGCGAKQFSLSEAATLAPMLPPGSMVQLSSAPGRFDLRVLSVPDEYADTDMARFAGARLTVHGAGLAGFGHLLASGNVLLGAHAVETDRAGLVSARYQVNGATLFGMLRRDPPRIVIKSDDLRSGAALTFVPTASDPASEGYREACEGRSRAAADEAETPQVICESEVHLSIAIPDPTTGLMRVTAISEFAPVDLYVKYYQTEASRIRPSVIDTMAKDPVLLLLVTLLAGAVAIIEFLRPSRKA